MPGRCTRNRLRTLLHFYSPFELSPFAKLIETVRGVAVERQRGYVMETNASTAEIEDGLIWDLINGTTGTVKYTFHAESQFDFLQL